MFSLFRNKKKDWRGKKYSYLKIIKSMIRLRMTFQSAQFLFHLAVLLNNRINQKKKIIGKDKWWMLYCLNISECLSVFSFFSGIASTYKISVFLKYIMQPIYPSIYLSIDLSIHLSHFFFLPKFISHFSFFIYL